MAGPNLKKLAKLGTRLLELRAERSELAKADKNLKDEVNATEQEMLGILDAAQLTNCGTPAFTVSVQTNTCARVTDWEGFYKFISKTKFFHLLQRRVSDPSWRELMEQRKGKAVPGVDSFEKKSISLTKKTA